MESLILLALLIVVIGALLIFMLRNSKTALRFRDASENEGSWVDRKAAHYLRKLSLLEIVAIVVVGAVLVFIQVKFGVRLF